MNQKFVVANWKMNPETSKEAQKIFTGIKDSLGKVKKTHVIIAPSFLHLSSIAHSYKGKRISFGAQDVATESQGSFTGEISAYQLKDARATYVIIGHSERRALGESNEVLQKKITVALKAGLSVIICIGEQERDKEGNYLSVVTEDLSKALEPISRKDIGRIIIAYEPVWAIGKSSERAMTPHQMHQMSLFIRKKLIELYGEKLAYEVPILYGGSVDTTNATELIKEGEIQGFLVGRASLDPKNFSTIIESVERYA